MIQKLLTLRKEDRFSVNEAVLEVSFHAFIHNQSKITSCEDAVNEQTIQAGMNNRQLSVDGKQ